MSFFSAIILALLAFTLDQWSKLAIIEFFRDQDAPYVVTSFFSLVLTGNPGISFGLMRMDQPSTIWIFIAGTLIGCGFIAYHMWSVSPQERIGYGLILGGGLGNILDRALYGRVVDFIDLHLNSYHWYTFNLADCWIVMGAALILCHWFFNRNEKNEQLS